MRRSISAARGKSQLLTLAITVLLQPHLAAQEPLGVSPYRIGPRDKVQISVAELEDLDRELEVAEDGSITVAEMGRVDAEGLTADQLAVRIRTQLESRGLRKATVNVAVTFRSSRPVSILGAVNNPGIHHVPRRTTLMEVLLSAGLDATHGPDIIVTRRAANGLSDEIRISVEDLLETGDPKANIPILAGDIIRVPPARELTVYFLGAVGEVGSRTIRGNRPVMLLTTLLDAGGPAETASNKILIRRLEASGERREIVVNYRRMLNGNDPDVELVDGDIIIVKESFF